MKRSRVSSTPSRIRTTGRWLAALMVALLGSALAVTPALAASPVASPQSDSVREGTVLPLFLDASDDDFDPLTYDISNAPDNGDLNDCSGGFCEYTPDPGFAGADSFQWHANDGTTDSNTATYLITVTANIAPIANDQTLSVRIDADLPIALDAFDDDNDDLTFAITNAPDHGLLDDCSGGFCTYTPTTGYLGPDSFEWQASDDLETSNTATVSITVTPNIVPVASDQTESLQADSVESVSLEASDDDFDALTFTITDAPDHGDLDDCSDGFCDYTPDPGYAGPDSFQWHANDGLANSNTATFSLSVHAVTVTVVTNDGAGAAALAAAMVRDPATLSGASFTAVTTQGAPNGTSTALDEFPTHGSTFGVLTSGDASLADDPNDSTGSGESNNGPNVRGDTDFDVTVLKIDLVAPAGINCLRLDLAFYSEEYPEYVGSFNDAIIAELDTSTWTTSGQAITAPGNFAFDATGDVISVNSSGATSMSAAHAVGTTYDGATVLLRAATQVTPGAHSLFLSVFDQGDHVLDSAAFIDNIHFVTVGDPSVDCAEGAEVPTNTDPVAVDDSATTPYQTAIDIDVLDNDSDPDGDPITVTLTTAPANGTVAINPDGTVKYTPNASYSGPDSFTYTISDGQGGTDTATVSITVTAPPVNPPPTSDAGADKAGTEGAAISLDGTVTNTPAGDTVTSTWSYTLGAGTDAGMTCAFGNASAVDTTITCTDDGQVTVKLTVSDGVNPPVEDTASLAIANADPSVTITSPADAAAFQTGATVAVSASFTDAGANDTHTCSIDWGDGTTTTGSIASGTCTGSHAYAAIGVPTVTVTVTDDDTGSGSDSIMVVIAEAKTKVTGGGWITYDNAKLRFGFVAHPAAGGQPEKGEIQVRWGKHKFHGKSVSGLVVNKPQATWTGTGRYDGQTGYTYQVTVIDNGNGGGKGKTPDRFRIVIRDPAGTIVLDTSGPLAGGNIKIH